MTGWMKKYKESLRDTPGPIELKDTEKVNFDLRGLMKYAEEKSVQPIDLTEEEKQKFMVSDYCE